MDEEQVGLRAHRKLYGRETCVHCRRDASDRSVIFHLQSVYCAFEVLDFDRAQHFIAKLYEGREESLRHGEIKAERSGGRKANCLPGGKEGVTTWITTFLAVSARPRFGLPAVLRENW